MNHDCDCSGVVSLLGGGIQLKRSAFENSPLPIDQEVIANIRESSFYMPPPDFIDHILPAQAFVVTRGTVNEYAVNVSQGFGEINH
jgi:hypothetical protein